ncbi:MAG: polyprenyl synthetase family protein [Gemmatimonadales bacterium]|nr:MAG: polyprenyl synthetase family protein [Gemmatimonadales bacterium]
MSPEALSAWLVEERVRVEASLERALTVLLPRLPEALAEPVRHGVTTGGKRLRPILTAAAWAACREAAGQPAPVAVPQGVRDLAAAVELIHAYSLMHDDLPCMDDADLRRGRPTPHTIWGEGPVMRGGGALIPAAGLQLLAAATELGLDPDTKQDLLLVLARAAGGEGMVGGQALDLEGEGRALGREALDDLHRRKTGALLVASLELGAVAAEAPAGVREGLVDYGRALGLAFQIADDVLDATATAEALGKNPSDEALDKSTYVVLLGVDGARREARSEVGRALEAMAEAGLHSSPLEALARYVVERTH